MINQLPVTSVKNKPLTVRGDELFIRDQNLVDLMQQVLLELKSIRLTLRIAFNVPDNTEEGDPQQ